jgi:hypothetical protein
MVDGDDWTGFSISFPENKYDGSVDTDSVLAA